MLVETPTLPTPTIDGKYRLEALIGEGAHGTVYRAVHVGLKKPFALKLLHASAARDPGLIGRFRREAEALGRLRHPAIVEVTDFGVEPENGPPYLVMELLEGRPLNDLLRLEGPLPLDRALPILEAIAGAIDAAHAEGVLHRDLKPANVLLGAPGGPVAKVLDFGLAELAGAFTQSGVEGFGSAVGFDSAHPAGLEAAVGFDSAHPTGLEADTSVTGGPRWLSGAEATLGSARGESRLTATGALLGTPLYVAPEVIEGGRARRASDLYSFGVLAYEMLAGSPPFQGSTGEVLAAHLRREPPGPPNLGSSLPTEAWEALRPALSKDPAARPTSAGELVERLRAAGRAAAARIWRQRETPRRFGLAALLAFPLLLAGVLSRNPVWTGLEAFAFDTGLRVSPPLPANPKIVLLTLDSPGPTAPALAFADRGPEIARISEAIFAAGARGIAFDILPPSWWANVEPIQELLLRHAERLTLVATSAGADPVKGTEFVNPLTLAQLGPKRAEAMFGFINLAQGRDRTIRYGRTTFRTTSGAAHQSWAARAAAQLTGKPIPPILAGDPNWKERSTFAIDYRINPNGYLCVPLEQAASLAAAHPETFRDRLVLLGGHPRSPYQDVQPVPSAAGLGKDLAGVLLQALQIDTLSRGMPLRSLAARPFTLGAALLAFAAAAGVLLSRRAGALLAIATALAALAVAATIVLFRQRGLLVPWTPVAAFWTLGALLPGAARLFLSRVPLP